MKLFLMVAALAASALTIVPTVAHAATTNAEGERIARVAYGDLDLSTAGGKARLDQRIKAAVRQVCERPVTAADLTGSTDYYQCLVKARATAKSGVQLALNGAPRKARNA